MLIPPRLLPYSRVLDKQPAGCLETSRPYPWDNNMEKKWDSPPAAAPHASPRLQPPRQRSACRRKAAAQQSQEPRADRLLMSIYFSLLLMKYASLQIKYFTVIASNQQTQGELLGVRTPLQSPNPVTAAAPPLPPAGPATTRLPPSQRGDLGQQVGKALLNTQTRSASSKGVFLFPP